MIHWGHRNLTEAAKCTGNWKQTKSRERDMGAHAYTHIHALYQYERSHKHPREPLAYILPKREKEWKRFHRSYPMHQLLPPTAPGPGQSLNWERVNRKSGWRAFCSAAVIKQWVDARRATKKEKLIGPSPAKSLLFFTEKNPSLPCLSISCVRPVLLCWAEVSWQAPPICQGRASQPMNELHELSIPDRQLVREGEKVQEEYRWVIRVRESIPVPSTQQSQPRIQEETVVKWVKPPASSEQAPAVF